MEKFRLANLNAPPEVVFIGDGDFTIERQEWIQPPDKWTAFYYQHANVVSINADVIAIEPDTIVMFAPTVRATNAKIGEGTQHQYLTFDLPAVKGDRLAIPLVVPNMARIFVDWRRASERVAEDRLPTVAFAWNLMWSLARNPVVLRERKELYAAEEWIYRNLNQKFSVPQLAEAVGVSPRKLLYAFHEEHRTSVQAFIRNKRVQEACRLLATTSIPIKEVAMRVGIPDLHAFNKIVRMDTGRSPRVFRQLGSRNP